MYIVDRNQDRTFLLYNVDVHVGIRIVPGQTSMVHVITCMRWLRGD